MNGVRTQKKGKPHTSNNITCHYTVADIGSSNPGHLPGLLRRHDIEISLHGALVKASKYKILSTTDLRSGSVERSVR